MMKYILLKSGNYTKTDNECVFVRAVFLLQNIVHAHEQQRYPIGDWLAQTDAYQYRRHIAIYLISCEVEA